MLEQTETGKGLDPVIECYKKDIDVTLIRENLRLTVDQRFQQLMDCRNSRKSFNALAERHAHKAMRLANNS